MFNSKSFALCSESCKSEKNTRTKVSRHIITWNLLVCLFFIGSTKYRCGNNQVIILPPNSKLIEKHISSWPDPYKIWTIWFDRVDMTFRHVFGDDVEPDCNWRLVVFHFNYCFVIYGHKFNQRVNQNQKWIATDDHGPGHKIRIWHSHDVILGFFLSHTNSGIRILYPGSIWNQLIECQYD